MEFGNISEMLDNNKIKNIEFFQNCISDDILQNHRDKLIESFLDYMKTTKDYDNLYDFIYNNQKNKNFWNIIKLDLIKSHKDSYKLIGQKLITILCHRNKNKNINNTQDILNFLNQILTKNSTSLTLLTAYITTNITNVIIKSLNDTTDYKSITSFIFSNFGHIFVKKIHKNIDSYLTKYNTHPDKNVYTYTEYEDNLIYTLFLLLEMYFYLEKYNKDGKDNNINWKYIASNKCNFNWYKKKYTDRNDYSLRDKLFFTVLYCAHLIYAPTIKKIFIYPKYIISLQNYLARKNQLYDFIIKREDVDKKITMTREYLKKYEGLISLVNDRMISFYNNYSKYLYNEINSNNIIDIHFDEITDDFLLFLKYNYKNDVNTEVFKILFLSTDPDILNLNYYTIGSIFTVIEKVFEKYTVQDSYILYFINIVRQVIKLSEIGSEGDGTIDVKHECYHSMCKLINNNNVMKNIFDDNFKDYYSSIKFINSFLKDINTIVNYMRIYILNTMDGVEESIVASKTHFKLLWNLCDMNNTKSIIFDTIIYDELLKTINNTVNIISKFILNYKLLTDDNQLMKYIHIVFETITKMNDIKKINIQNALDYSKDSYIKLMEYCIKREFNYDFVNIIEILTYNHDQDNDYDNDQEIPDKFLDPLTFMLITDPVVLPGNSQEAIYIDRSTIVKCLLEKEEDPFTRNKLTIKELDDYNRSDEAIELIKIFKEDYKYYKNKK